MDHAYGDPSHSTLLEGEHWKKIYHELQYWWANETQVSMQHTYEWYVDIKKWFNGLELIFCDNTVKIKSNFGTAIFYLSWNDNFNSHVGPVHTFTISIRFLQFYFVELIVKSNEMDSLQTTFIP